MNLFITGTDTGVGKTYLTCLLLRALRQAGHHAAGFKPIACGDRDDAQLILDASAASAVTSGAGEGNTAENLTLDDINPIHYAAPVAPFAAAQLANKPALDLDAIHRSYQALATRFDTVLVEGVGGWEVPLSPDNTVADLAETLGLPVVLIVANRLGALNHTLLTAHAIRRRGLTLAGLVINHIQDELDLAAVSNLQILRQTLPETPILAEILHADTTLDPAPFL